MCMQPPVGTKNTDAVGLQQTPGEPLHPCPRAIPEITLVMNSSEQQGQKDSEPGGSIRHHRGQPPERWMR